ncbi:MAG: hypothetical protein A2666_03585 [Parcubacteria group bacterium RIFCSPHIGHO2_01_FULL_47_10b]|nr:MAG: hypothetical protein A2666_03585 [Parcubacteria group bacterium RIFCSPHIGHO2_01_FULL_47_10b]
MQSFGGAQRAVTGESFLDLGAILRQLSFVTPGKYMADFGCGSGYLTSALAQYMGDAGKIYAIDVQQHALDVVKQQSQSRGFTSIEPIRANLEASHGTPLRDNSLDVVWMVNLLFQNQRKDAIFVEAYRVLKPGCMLVVIDWIPNLTVGPEGYRLSLEEVMQLAQRGNFAFVQKIQAGRYHHGSVYMKQGASQAQSQQKAG